MSEIPLPSSLAALINWSSEAWTNALEAVSKAFFSRCHHSRACLSRMTCCAEIQSPEWSATARTPRAGHAAAAPPRKVMNARRFTQSPRRRALQDPVHVPGAAPEQIRQGRAVGHETAGPHVLLFLVMPLS